MRRVIENADFYCADGVISDQSLLIEDDVILGLIAPNSYEHRVERIDAKFACVSPGFIDLQVNGGGGSIVQSGFSEEAIRTIDTSHLLRGTTRWLPTLISASPLEIVEFAERIRSECGTRGIIGAHFEGPWISAKFAGAHPQSNLRAMSESDLGIIAELSENCPCVVTLDPDAIDDDKLQRLTRLRKCVLSVGHSSASYERMMRVIELGVRGVTHAMNSHPGPVAREPGLITAAIESEQVWISVIADGHHVSWPIIRLLKTAAAESKVFVVTDAMPPAGTAMEVFQYHGEDIVVRNGGCFAADGRLTGSAATLSDSILNCVQKVGIPLDEAIKMATQYPAEFLGVSERLGRIAPGYKADLVCFSNQLSVKWVMRNGEVSGTGPTQVA